MKNKSIMVAIATLIISGILNVFYVENKDASLALSILIMILGVLVAIWIVVASRKEAKRNEQD